MSNFFRKGPTHLVINPRQKLMGTYFAARHSLLLVVIFTAINVILSLTGSFTYFLFSASIPYILVDMGMFLTGKYPAEYYATEFPGEVLDFYEPSYLVVMVIIAAVVLGVYLLCWILSKKMKVGWLITALVLFCLDTLFFFYNYGFDISFIIDIIFHALVIYELAAGIVSYNKLKALPPEEETPVTAEAAVAETVTEDSLDGAPAENDTEAASENDTPADSSEDDNERL